MVNVDDIEGYKSSDGSDQSQRPKRWNQPRPIPLFRMLQPLITLEKVVEEGESRGKEVVLVGMTMEVCGSRRSSRFRGRTQSHEEGGSLDQTKGE